MSMNSAKSNFDGDSATRRAREICPDRDDERGHSPTCGFCKKMVDALRAHEAEVRREERKRSEEAGKAKDKELGEFRFGVVKISEAKEHQAIHNLFNSQSVMCAICVANTLLTKWPTPVSPPSADEEGRR